MFENTLVFAAVPSSTSEKFDSGDGDAVNGKEVEPFGVASLMTVIDPGKITASADNERSWLPPDPSRSTRLVWYGEPEIATAELLAPQSCRVEMWPAHARTGFAWLALNVSVIEAEVSPTKPEGVCVYELTPVIVPPYIVKLPATGVTPPPVTCGSAGIGKVVGEPHPAMPRHGFASA